MALEHWRDSLVLHDNSSAMEWNCSGDISRGSCYLTQDEIGKRDTIAFVRLVVSLISFLGSLSIIFSALIKKQVFSPKVHPIFMLSIADIMLSVMWVVGGATWLSEGAVVKERVGCLAISLMTIILECVAVNLTLVYALLAYSGIKQRDFSNVYMLFGRAATDRVWSISRTVTAYTIAWILPVVLIMVPFSAVAGKYHLVKHSTKCSCWCLPYFGNVLPLAWPGDDATATYVHRMRMFVASYGFIIGTNYLVVFVLLVIIYWKILKRIKNMRKRHEQTQNTQNLYGATETVIIRGQSQAKTRVVAFLTIFVITGFSNVFMSYTFTGYEGVSLYNKEKVIDPYANPHWLPTPVFILYIFQSVTVPLQGFLNAIVYGWTREDFVHIMATSQKDTEVNRIEDHLLESSESEDLDDSAVLSSTDGNQSSRSYQYPSNLTRGPLYTVTEETETENDTN